MLPAQVSYWTLRENERHNKVTEDLTQQQLAELARHNKQDEAAKFQTIAENVRNNLYNNGLGDRSLGVNIYDAQTRRYTATEQAAIGHKQASAALTSAGAAVQQAQAALQNAGTNELVGMSNARLNDTKRSQEILNGVANRNYTRARTGNMYAETELTQAQRDKTAQEAMYVKDYRDIAVQEADIKQQEAYNHQFGKILDNLTPWR